MSASIEAASTALSPEQLGAYLQDKLGEKVLDVTVAYGQVTVTVEPAALVDAATLCRNDDALDFEYWEFNSGVDLAEEGFALVTGLYSIGHGHRIALRIVVPGGRDAPVAPSLVGVYRGANWSERETYDMFGISFDGHPSVEPRILTVENFEGWPLRKEFLLMTREAKPWPGDKEPGDAKNDAKGPAKDAAKTNEAPISAEDKANAAKAKAERAKAKAAAARAKKARERAEAEQGPADGDQVERPQAEGNAPAADTAGDTPVEPDAEGDAEGERAAAAAASGAEVPEGTPDPTDPEGAAEAAGSPIAKDAAAGAIGGDVAAGAPGDSPGTDQPVDDPEHEAKMGEGGAPAASGSPGIEAEGRHEGADEQSGTKPAADTPGMTADPDEPDEPDEPDDPDEPDEPQIGVRTLAEEQGLDDDPQQQEGDGR